MKRKDFFTAFMIVMVTALIAGALSIAPGSADVSINLQLNDATDGVTPETGLTITDINMTYIRPGQPAVKADANALADVNSAHSDNYAIEIDDTNAPGLYRFDFPDAAFAGGADYVSLAITCPGVKPVIENVTLNTQIAAILADTGEIQSSMAAPPEPNGVATTGYEMIHQLFGRFFYKSTMTSTQLTTYDSNDVINTIQTISDDGTTQTVIKATAPNL